ncbi:MAG: Spore photoproduct lyase [uncultured Thermomicrobiales bacterium]|uniref:Spore photoproduct lyase n=1 Tax=uncultured Thermomicrobiales bacterium TaxID=1645740 RepID=A0A6J4VNZ9_9BACT|nr:MAG: Spore photoproduct lyase [uncultured Thermomicrobiales bacterium]
MAVARGGTRAAQLDLFGGPAGGPAAGNDVGEREASATVPWTPPAPGLLDIERVYVEPAAREHPRGQAILARFPDAERIEVASHWRIPELHGDPEQAARWNVTKRTSLVLGAKRDVGCRPYERSCDFVAPSVANGCAMSCAYCYVARRKGFANPITAFVNIDQIAASIRRHAARQGPKPAPTQADPGLWVYELGTNSDCAVDAKVSDNIADLVALFRDLPHAKATFATKYVNPDLLGYEPRGKTRLRFSLMPEPIARVTDVRTSPVRARIAAIDDLVAAGWEVNLNFGPVIVTDGWLQAWRGLFREVAETLSAPARAQLAAEVIFLTHSAELHEINLAWHPTAEALLWRPEIQEPKVSGTGGHNLRYRLDHKRGWVRDLVATLREELPECSVRYAF